MKRSLRVFVLALLIAMISTLPVQAATNSPWGSSSLGKIHRKAAVVGKVIAHSSETDSYVVYGRLSIDSGQGYRVHERRKFYRVYPRCQGANAALSSNIGSGLKVFGTYELCTGSGNEEKLLADEASPYDPATDISVGEEPAYGPGVGPYDWVGFGVPVITTKAFDITVNRSSDVVNILAQMYDAVDFRNQNQENARQILKSLNPESIKQLRQVWQQYKISWFIEKDLEVLNQMRQAIGGSTYYFGLHGETTDYIEQVPLLRPQVDTYMRTVEMAPQGQFEEWACPAAFYGKISRHYIDEENQSVYFNGVYFQDDKPRNMVNSISSQNDINKENWRIEGLNKYMVESVNQKYCWFSGQRVLVYEYTDDEGKTHTVYIYDGSLKDDPEYTLVDYYITINKILTKAEYNIMLDLTRELAMRGGV